MTTPNAFRRCQMFREAQLPLTRNYWPKRRCISVIDIVEWWQFKNIRFKSMKRVLNVKHYQDPYLRTDTVEGFPGGSVVKNLLAHAGDIGSIPDQGRSHKQWNNKTRAQLLSLCSRARALKDDTTMRSSPCTANRPMDCSLPASSVHEIFQARTLE